MKQFKTLWILFVVLTLVGCSNTPKVEFNKRTEVTFGDGNDPKMKAVITCHSVAGTGISIEIENTGTEEIVLWAKDMFYEDRSGNPIKAVNSILTAEFHGGRRDRGFDDREYFPIPSGEKNVGAISPPLEARSIVVKDADHKKDLLRIMLR